MQFIQYDILQIGKNKIKTIFAVVWKHGTIQHIRIGKNDIGTLPDPFPLIRRGISVVNSR